MLKFQYKKIARVRRIAVTLGVIVCALILSVQMALAAAPSTVEAAVAQQQDTFCVQGTVIGHDEKPLTDGWQITASSTAISQTQVITTDSNGAFTFTGLPIGTWHFQIAVKPGWEPITPDQFDVTGGYSTGCLTIRFKLRRIVEVIVYKIDDDHNPWAGWTICAEPGAGNFFATRVCKVTGADGSVTFTLTPGNWTFIESPPAGVPLIPVLPASDRQSINVQPPGPIILRFKNIAPLPKGCIDVIKYDSPPGDQEPFPLPGWKITVLRADGSVAASGQTNALGRISFCNLPIGPYTVVEEQRNAWQPTSSPSISVTVVTGQRVAIEFRNKQDRGFCFVGRKIDTNGKVGLPGWQITATPVAVGGIFTDTVTTDGLGYYRICFPKDDYRILGATYKICEVMQSGWLAHTPTCYLATLPQYPDAPVRVPDFENQQVGHAESQGGNPSNMPGCRLTHTVKSGEYLSGIAVQYGVGTYALMRANPWVLSRYQNYIRAGEQLCIP